MTEGEKQPEAFGENRHLKETILCLREALETARLGSQTALAGALAEKESQIQERKAAVAALRRKLKSKAWEGGSQ